MSVESNGLFIQMLLIPYQHKHITCIVSAWHVNLSQLKGTPEALPCFLSPKAIQVQTINTIFVACAAAVHVSSWRAITLCLSRTSFPKIQ